jgi:hypothetical protein
MIKLSKSPASKLGFGVQLIFQITQNNTPSGRAKPNPKGFFDNHHIVGIKLQDYLD